MEPKVFRATKFDEARVPAGFVKPPIVAILLPLPGYMQLLGAQEHRSYTLHMLFHPGFNLFEPLQFDAEQYIQEVLEYCRLHKVQGVTAYDTFPKLMAAVVTEELKLPGPNFKSAVICDNKYYMRQFLTPDFQPIHTNDDPPEKYPVVVKLSDTQFYVGVRICKNEDEWKTAKEELSTGRLSVGLHARKQFYFKWATYFGWEIAPRWEEVHLIHTEPFICGKSEHQVEVVVTDDHHFQIADTGDLIKSETNPNCGIAIFKTPGDFHMTPVLRKWLYDLVGRLAALGFSSAASDMEFFRLDCEEERYELTEINPRYSFMGFWKMLSNLTQGEVEFANQNEVRNLLNRTRLALGAPPATLPVRDHTGYCKLAGFVYTDQIGPLETFFNADALKTLIAEGALDAFTPKPPLLRKAVIEEDLNHGWAKVCCLLFTLPNNATKINSAFDYVLKTLFCDKDTGFLPLRVGASIDQDLGNDRAGFRAYYLVSPESTHDLADGRQVCVFKDDAAVSKQLVAEVTAAAYEAIAAKGSFSLCIPAGSVVAALKGLDPDEEVWSKVNIFFTGERLGANKSYLAALDAFCERCGIRNVYEPLIRPLFSEGGPLPEFAVKEAAAAYTGLLKNHPAIDNSGPIPSFDLLLLGVGEDGHCGSLHPMSDHIKAAGDGTVTFGIHKAGKNQIAISMDVMNASKKVILAATGEKKQDAVRRSLSGDFEPFNCPAALVKAKETAWYTDKAAMGDYMPS